MVDAVITRPALESDIPSINAVHTYYVRNTVITFRLDPSTDEEMLVDYQMVMGQSLPYIVAVESSGGRVVGYIYASGFRSVKAGYRHTVEISLFCEHEHQNKGVGSLLMKKLLDILKEPKNHPEYIPSPRPNDAAVRQVIACIAVDETGRKGGLGLKEWYERFGFKEVGHLKMVGHKFDRWIDTMYLQLSLW